jgi:hypothetical protein
MIRRRNVSRRTFVTCDGCTSRTDRDRKSELSMMGGTRPHSLLAQP